MNIGYFQQAQKIISKDEYGGQIWISGNKFAQNQQNICKYKFVLVFSCMDTEFRFKNQNVQHLRFPIEDTVNFDIKAYFEPSFQVIQAARKTGNVLIYSTLGISRCTTIAMSYIMKKYNKKWKQTLQQIRVKRPCAQPSQNYMKQLQWYQKFILNRL